MAKAGAAAADPALMTPEERGRALMLAHPDNFTATILVADPELRARHVRFMRVLTVLAFLLPASLAANFYQATRPPRLVGVSSTPDGSDRVVNTRLNALYQPINTQAEIRNWVTDAVVQAYTFDFAGYNLELQASRPNFTTEGWAGFHKAIQDSGVLKDVIEGKFKITAVPAGQVVEATLPKDFGRTARQYEVPIVVTYEGPSQKPSKNLLVDVLVVPQPVWQQERGLGIASMTLGGGLGAP